MKQPDADVLQALQRQERERLLQSPRIPRPEYERQTVHWSELTKLPTGIRIATEWNFYLEQIERLLAEGREGKWVLIQGREIVGVWDTEAEADRARVERFLMQDVLIQQVLVREPILRGPGYLRRCPD